MANASKRMSKGKKTAIWIISVIVAIFIILFVAFLISEQTGKTIEPIKNQSQEPEPENASEPEPAENISEPEPPSLEPFTYHNLSFVVEQKGSRINYITKMKFLDRHGLKPAVMNISFKTDPRQLDISSDLEKMPAQKTYVSFENTAFTCNDSTMAAITLGYFLGLLGVNAKSAVVDPKMASGDFEDEVKNCSDATASETVIILKGAGEATIKQEEDCIVAGIAKCESVKTVDALILNLIELGISQGIIETREF